MINPEMMAAVLQHAAGAAGGPQAVGPGRPPPDTDSTGKPTPLSATQDCIQDLHELLTLLPDPVHTQMATQALQILTKIQSDIMRPKGGGPQMMQGGQ